MSSLALYSSFYNEQSFARKVIEGVLGQELRPKIWVIVDDGSTDETLKILRHFEHKVDWITILTMPKKEKKDLNTAGIAWNKALQYIRDTDMKFDFYGKLDGDMLLPSNYYRKITNFLKKNPIFKIVSGRIFIPQHDHFIPEDGNPNAGYLIHPLVRGACFVCDGPFFEAIPLEYFPTVCHECYLYSKVKMWGYKSASINIPAYQLRRSTRDPYGGSTRDPYKFGQSMYYFNLNPLLYIIPFIIWYERKHGTEILRGYLHAKKRKWKINDPEEKSFWMWQAPIRYNRVFEKIRFLRTPYIKD